MNIHIILNTSRKILRNQLRLQFRGHFLNSNSDIRGLYYTVCRKILVYIEEERKNLSF